MFEVMSLHPQEWDQPCRTHCIYKSELPSGLVCPLIERIMMSKEQRRERKKKLEYELSLVRGLFPKIEERLLQVKQSRSALSDAHFFQNGTKAAGRKEATLHLELMRLRPASDGNLLNLPTSKRTPKANQLYNNTEFLVGKDKMPPPVKPKLKRSASNVSGGDRKRKRGGMSKAATSKCKSILKKLMLHDDGWVFNEPVDVVTLQLTDYHSVIKNPMDLGTIKKKLDKRRYTSPSQVADDVRLTFANAMSYNPPGNDVHTMALNLSGLFEKEWKVVSEKFERADLALPGIEGVLESDAKTKKSLAKAKAPPKPRNSTTPKGKVPKRKMDFQEKTKLRNNLQLLPQHMLEEIVQWMRERKPDMHQNDEVVEVDLESFDNDTLWELDRRSKSCLKKLRESKKSATDRSQLTSGNTGQETGNQKAAEKEPVPVSRSSSSSSSSSDSGSSSDSDSGSSSSSESDG